MKIPHKIRIFAWKACNDSLPCFFNLFKRKLPVDSQFKFCQAPIEDLLHALFYCPNIKENWPLFLPFMIEASHIFTFMELAMWVKNRDFTTELEKFYIIA